MTTPPLTALEGRAFVVSCPTSVYAWRWQRSSRPNPTVFRQVGLVGLRAVPSSHSSGSRRPLPCGKVAPLPRILKAGSQKTVCIPSRLHGGLSASVACGQSFRIQPHRGSHGGRNVKSLSKNPVEKAREASVANQPWWFVSNPNAGSPAPPASNPRPVSRLTSNGVESRSRK